MLCLGETLWDVLPTGEFLGGAPLNVAAHLTRLGTPAVLVSRVGTDPRGERALAGMRALGLSTDQVQRDAELPTGVARATLDATGSASYEFPQPAAWDRIESNADILALAGEAPAVVFGTLALRSAASRDSILRILAASRWRVLDVNLRAPHDERGTALAALECADFVKLNEHELERFAGWLDVPAAPEALQVALHRRFGTQSLCITQGAAGAALWHEGSWVHQPAYPTTIADTIGAGDAFLARLLAELFAGSPASRAMQRAARLASFVASRPGAVPVYDAEFDASQDAAI